jgi:uncharacterized protein (DUF58 family)
MKIRWLLIIVLVLSLALTLLGGFAMFWRFFIFGVALILLSFLWLKYNAQYIDGRVEELPRYCQVGEQFEEELTFVNRGGLPTATIEAKQNTTIPGYRDSVYFHVGAHGTFRWKTTVACTRRGEYGIGSVTARISDPLGLITIKKNLSYGHYVIVFPKTIDVPYFQALPHQEPGSSPRRWFASQTSPNASRVREYLSGDSLRNIHWHTTAHTGKLMVKEYDPDRLNYLYKDIWIILDLKTETPDGEGAESTAEYGVTIAASLAKKYLENGKQVGLLATGDKSYLFLPDNNEDQMDNLMRALAVIQPGGAVSIDGLLAAQEDRFTHGSAVIVITSSDVKNIGYSLRRIVKRGAIVTAILLDAASFGGKVGAFETARTIVTTGVHTYIIRKGADFSRALDSRFLTSPMQDTGVKNR